MHKNSLSKQKRHNPRKSAEHRKSSQRHSKRQSKHTSLKHRKSIQRRSKRKSVGHRKSFKRHSKRKAQKGGEGFLKSLLLDPINRSSNLISNLKDHNVLVDRFSDMKNEISKINKRIDQLEAAFKKLQLQK